MARGKNKKGFTLIEILMIVAIIAILVSVVLVSLFSARQKSRDVSAFTSFKSAAAPAFACLASGLPNIRLSEYTAPSGGNSLCSVPSGADNSVWSDFSKTGWSDFHWCAPGYSGLAHPDPTTCIAYADGTCGGSRGTGNFCFMIQNDDDKFIWCTLDGCRKEGF